jgi:hypothetical protein
MKLLWTKRSSHIFKKFLRNLKSTLHVRILLHCQILRHFLNKLWDILMLNYRKAREKIVFEYGILMSRQNAPKIFLFDLVTRYNGDETVTTATLRFV